MILIMCYESILYYKPIEIATLMLVITHCSLIKFYDNNKVLIQNSMPTL